jgi:2-dehydro-3-deoxyphosphogluconate aldolase/(4S)-4-hydroxy-2-oxoglutarate aldolase
MKMANTFSLKHIGINTGDAREAESLANALSMMFNFTPRMGNKSVFAGSVVECMKAPYLGTHGHIALETPDLEAAVEELKGKGFSFNMDTAAYTETGKLKNVYLDGEFGGFAIHIMQQ